MSKKNSHEVRQGLLKSRLTEKQIDRSLKKMQRSEKKLLLEIKHLLDSNNEQEARLLTKELLSSRKTIKELGKMKFYMRGIQHFFKSAQVQLLKGETLDTIAKSLIKVNQIMSTESLDKTFIALESEFEELNINMEQANESLELLNEPNDEEDFVEDIISELKSVTKEKAPTKINELVSLSKILPPIPKFDNETEDEDFEELED
jgi:hypothetical protein